MAKPSNSTVNVQAAAAKRLKTVRELCESYAYQKAQHFAQEQAHWTDRTGDARKLLKGYVIDNADIAVETYKHEGDQTVPAGTKTIDGKGAVGFGIVHRMVYGKHLERDGDGANAILKPTIERFREQFLAQVREIMGGTV
jgi:hypothetical protein